MPVANRVLNQRMVLTSSVMSERQQEFAEFLARIRNEGPSGEEDRERIAFFPEDRPTRHELPIPHDQPSKHVMPSHADFLAHGNGGAAVPVYPSLDQGLAAHGWSLIPKKPRHLAGPLGRLTPPGARLGEGSYGFVLLAYMRREERVRLEYRHLCAVKITPRQHRTYLFQDPDEEDDIPALNAKPLGASWTEANVLRGCVHPNILAYYGHFAVRLPSAKQVDQMSIVHLLEYASAGSLEKEIRRYPGHKIPESGALYYIRHVLRGLAYLHRKCVAFNDLSDENVLLRYNRDSSKTAMLADPGIATVHDPIRVQTGAERLDTRRDVKDAVTLVDVMVQTRRCDPRKLSPEFKILMHALDDPDALPVTVPELLLDFKWFTGVADAPFPPSERSLTPLLDSDTIHRMGFYPNSRQQSTSSMSATDSWTTARMGPSPTPSATSLYTTPLASLPHQPQSETRSGVRRRSTSTDSKNHCRQQVSQASSHSVFHVAPQPDTRQQRSLGQRIRRSVSAIGRRLNCFRSGHRHEHR